MAESSSNNQDAKGSGGGAASGAPGDTSRRFNLRHIYLKDLSFEAPNSPGILTETGLEPEFNLNLRTSHRDLGSGIFEVVLHVNVHGVDGKRTMFLVELEQAGTFQISGYSPEETRTIVGVTCPNILFPYAREAVSSILTRGSFSQLLLKPIDFAALFERAQIERTQASSRDAVTPPAGQA